MEPIDAFVRAAQATFESMLGVPLQPGETIHGEGAATGCDVSAIVGLSDFPGDAGRNSGSLVISMESEVARNAVARILGWEELSLVDQHVADGIGELANVIAGNAKAQLSELGVDDCKTSLPSVVLGSRHRVFHQTHAERFAVQCSTEIGSFLLQVLVRHPLASTPPGSEAAGRRDDRPGDRGDPPCESS